MDFIEPEDNHSPTNKETLENDPTTRPRTALEADPLEKAVESTIARRRFPLL
jgi:hypothetical protein